MGTTSAGSIQLDLEVNAKLEESTKKEAEKIVKVVKEQLGNMKENMFVSLSKSVENAMKSMTEAVKKQTEASKKIMQSFIRDLQKMIAEMKFTAPKMPFNEAESTASNSTASNPASPRAPPLPTVSIPLPKMKLDDQFETDMMEQKINELTSSLELLDSKIQSLQANRKSLLSESLKAEATNDINALRSLDDQVMKLDAQIAALQDSSARTSITLEALARKRTVDVNLAPVTAEAQSSNGILGKLKNTISQIVGKAKSATSSLLKLGDGAKTAGRSVGQSHMSFKRFMQSMLLFSLLMPAITSSIRAMGSSLLSSLKTNNQFAESLKMIKSNLNVAFTPIYEAILPAINAFMSGLSTLSAYIAGFISAIFGKTLKQSIDSTKSLVAAKNAMGAYGTSAKQAAKDVGALAAIDEINTLQMDDGSSGAGAASTMPEIITPNLDTTAIDNQMSALADRLKNAFSGAFSTLTDVWNNGGKKVFEELKRLGGNVVDLFVYIANRAVEIAGPALELLVQGAGWLLEKLNDLIKWLLGDGKPVLDLIIFVLLDLAAAFLIVKTAIGVFNIVSGIFGFLSSSIGIAVLAIAGIIAIGYLLITNWEEICAVAKDIWNQITNAFQQFDDFLTGIFTTDWSESFGMFGEILNAFFANCSNIWDSIKKIFGGIIDFIAGMFTLDWQRAWQGISNIFGGIFDGLVAIAKAPINMIIGIINALFDGINTLIGKVNGISLDIPLIGHIGFDIPTLPKISYLAKGGIVDSPTLSMVGEAGTEAVVPLENNTEWMNSLADKISQRQPDTSSREVVELLQQLIDLVGNLNMVFKLGDDKVCDIVIKSLQRYSKKTGKKVVNI